ncbi:MAG: MFS transporter [Selenomonas ruminantium]|uniref:MFS transporter n=1 Tax=Selenomonas ruminantium TaxID=971 RepID=A0A927WHB4_SELRU|nr:MFS transporter [Selenomonas ruminantium]MBE6084421.1 MFS transporter [Selenomonas ruminantium]
MILQRLESLPVGNFHYKLLLLTGLGWLFDSMDTGLIAFVLPVLAKEWALTPAQVGWIGSIGLIGMALGAVLAGTLADRIGRKRVFSLTVLLYSLSTGMCALSWSYESLLVFRFLVGFGLGGELPVAATLMSEYAPAHLRGRFIVLLESFWGVGWLVAACISYLLIPAFGWQIAFVIGTLPALYVFLIRLHMPESIRYLLTKNRIKEAQDVILMLERKLGVESKPFTGEVDMSKLSSQGTETKPKFTALWSAPFRTRTAMLWLAWFGIVFSYYGIFMWLPSIVYAQGFAVVKTFEYVLIMTLAQLPGYYAAAWLVDVIGRKYTLSLFLLLSGVCSFFFGNAETSTALLAWGSAMSFFNLGAWGVIYTYTPEQYPTAIRALGSGWAAGFGRIGGMLAPMLVGVMLGNAFGMNTIFLMFASVFVIISAVVILLGKESKKKTLEELEVALES